MSHTIADMCRLLRLAHIADAVQTRNDPQTIDLVEEILTMELEGRKRSKLSKLVHQAGFPHLKTFDGYVFDNIGFPPGCNRDKLQSLEWVNRKENVLMLGAVGTGKTHMAIALGVSACQQGMNVQFFRAAELVAILQEKFGQGLLTRYQAKVRKADLLILDEVGYVPFSHGQWTSIFGDNKLTAALIDRLVHHAHILTFTGESFRLKEALARK